MTILTVVVSAAWGARSPIWSIQAELNNDTGWGSPCLGSNGVVYQGDLDGALVAANATNGSIIWNIDLPNSGQASGASPVLNSTETRLYVASCWSPGRLYIIDPANGDVLDNFQIPTPGYLTGPNGGEKIGGGHHGIAISRDDSTIYLGSGNWIECNPCNEDVVDDRVLAISVTGDSASLKWYFSTTLEDGQQSEERWSFWANPSIAADNTIYIGTFNGFMYHLQDNGASYTLLHKFNFDPYKTPKAVGEGIPPEVWGSAAIASDGTVYVPSNDGQLWAFNPDLTQKWSSPILAYWGGTYYENFASPIIAPNGLIISSDESGRIYGVQDNGSSGSIDWNIDFGNEWFRTPAVASNGDMIVGSEKSGKYWCLDTDNGNSVWDTTVIGLETGCFPSIGPDSKIYVTGGYEGGLYCFQGDAPLADTDWPKGMNNLLNTGYAGGSAPDTTPPTPDPMTWASVPSSGGDSSILMTATTATDPSGVEYFFDETSGNPGGSDSGWQDPASYTDTGLNASTQYCYRVRARDKSPNQNATAYSSTQCATTDAPDTTPPTPDPMTWAAAPSANDHESISMTATTASDPSGVEYYFDETTGGPGGSDSGWQDSASYTDSGLSTATQYCYEVAARDKSANQNETAPSTNQCATTDTAPQWTVITSDDFEAGFGNWIDGGEDCSLYTDGTYAHQGSNAVLIVDNTSTSVTTTNNLALSSYDEVKVDFWYYPRSMDKVAEDFWLQISTNGGSNFTTVEEWNLDDEFVNDQFYPDSVIITGYTLNDQTQIRFRCDASGNKDYIYLDEIVVSASGGAPDTTPPMPDPMTWATAPNATGENSIDMTATTASDPSGVQYYFDETTGGPGGTDSGWQSSASYTDSGLTAATQYCYEVTARDQSVNLNETAASANQCATTDAPDTTPPSPDPMTWASAPNATGENSIDMVATTASDPSGVEYNFDETSGNPGGTDSGWQDNTSYTDNGLNAGTQYCYEVMARDKSVNHNSTAASSNQCATTDAPDTTPPTPDPMTWASVPAAASSSQIDMTATTASDPSGVEYSFDETSGNPGATDSGWQASASYSDIGLDADTQYCYRVQARDQSVNQNATAWSTTECATTEAGGWTQIISDYFEGGFGNWNDGGTDCLLYTGGTYAHQGSNAIDLQDNTDTSVMTTNNLDLSAYAEVKVDFWYYPRSFDNSAEDFWLQISTNDGSSFDTVEEWNVGDEFTNDDFYPDSVIITGYTLTNQTQIRFRCDASGDADDVYIDEVVVSAGGEPVPDTDPPTPNPATWASVPAAGGSDNISMTATTGSDPSGVEYSFDETSGNPGGSDSGWQTSASYTDSGLTESTQYCYRVRMRDQSPNLNTGSWSTTECATTTAGGETWQKVDERDASVSYTGDWESTSYSQAYMNTVKFTYTSGSTASYSFTGTQVRFYVYRFDDTQGLDVYIDDQFQQTVNIGSGSEASILAYESGILSGGSHTLRVERVSGEPHLDAFEHYGP